VSAAGGLAGFRRGGGRGWGRRWGRPRGSPRVRFGGSEEAFDCPAGQLGGARCWTPWRRKIPARTGRSRAMRGGGGFHGVPGRRRVAGRRRNEGEGAVHRAAPWWPAAGHEAVGGRARAVRLAGWWHPFYGRHARVLATTGTPLLDSLHSASSTGVRREPGGGPLDNTERGGGKGRDSTWRGADFRDPRSAPTLGRSGLGTARGWP
jgi:hypothetical protein